MSFSNKIQVAPELNSDVILKFLIDHLQNANLLSEGETREISSDLQFETSEEFWKSILAEKTSALHWVVLNGFQVVDWYPRSPGLYHTEGAFYHRQDADHYIGGQKDGVIFYEPYGKANLIQGGLGSIRFKPLAIEGQDCWLCTATSDGFCHSGIPLAIPQRLMDKARGAGTNLCKIIGQVRFLPEFIQPHFGHITRVPQVYVLVDRIDNFHLYSRPIYITPVVFFTTRQITHQNEENNATFVTCLAGDYTELDRAAEWLDWYAQKYRGVVITNFDQQRPTFENAPFSLQHVMSGHLQTELVDRLRIFDHDLLSAAIERVNSITLINKGEINLGDTINMSGDFRGAILSIKSTLDNVSQSISSIPNTDPLTKEELIKLFEQLKVELQKVPPAKIEHAEAVTEFAKVLVEASTKEQPNKTTISITAEGLILQRKVS